MVKLKKDVQKYAS